MTPQKARIWCVTGEFEEIYTTVNFARRMVNLGLGGVCVETTGRLRPDVKMNVEVRFDQISGSLRSEARIVWVDTQTQGSTETHKAGLKFVGTPEITRPVRELLQGVRGTMIMARRQAEFQELKQKSETKTDLGRKKGSLLKKLIVTLLILGLLYVGSFWVLVLLGRTGAQDAGLRFRYLAPDSKAEPTLAKLYSPLVWVFRKAGISLVYDAEGQTSSRSGLNSGSTR